MAEGDSMKILEKMKGIKDIIGSFKSDWARDKYVRKLKYQIALAKRRNRIRKEESGNGKEKK